MRKRDELADPNSCLNRAREDEMVFVILGRNAAAQAAIVAWVHERVRLGKNSRGDAQIMDALQCAQIMLAERSDDGETHGV